MPLIEELPITQTHRATHGWAYVPVADPSISAPIAATLPGNRKRNRDGTVAATATAKQQKAVQARLDSLGRENYRDGVSIPIPTREKGKREAGAKKMTPNVRRILTSQRAFAHYLADEEAMGNTTTAAPTVASSTAASNTTAQTPTQPQAQASAKTDGRRRESTTGPRRGRPSNAERERRQKEKENGNTMQPPPTPIKQEAEADKQPKTDPNTDVTMTDAPSSPPPNSATSACPTPSTAIPRPPTYDPKLDSNPLLRTTGLPKMPSARVMALLLAEPPLSYAAARAKVSVDVDDEKPVRRFCGVCGYWGKIKCRKCRDWNCGLMECWKGHEGVCVAKGAY